MKESLRMTGHREIVFDEKTIQAKVAELAVRISGDYEGKDLVLVCILKGAAVFTADLMRKITVPLALDFVLASSYGMSSTASAGIRLNMCADRDVRGRHVLLVDTIVDTGRTLACVEKKFQGENPASLEAVILLDKKLRRVVETPIKYRGFEISDGFIVGYGIDLAERHRNLPYFAAVPKTDLPPNS
jgi:hypoxanthine phosphoribosyltransferase